MYIDFFLFITILFLSLLNAYISHLIQPLLKWFNRASSRERGLMDQKLELQSEQSQFRMVDNFAKHAKIQRKINAINEELSKLKSDRSTSNFVTRLFFQYGMKVPISIILVLMIILYRKSPVFILSDQIDLFPFSSFISYPLKEVNSVSVHVWVMCCGSMIKLIKT